MMNQGGFVFDINNYDIKKVEFKGYVLMTALDRNTNKEVDIKICAKNHRMDAKFLMVVKGDLVNDAYFSQYLDFPGIVKLIGFRPPLTEKEKSSSQCLSYKWERYDIDLTGFISVFEHMKYTIDEKVIRDYHKSKKSQILNPTVINKLIFGVSVFMKQMHSQNVTHNNLTYNNICLDDNFEPRICNFCSSHFIFSNDYFNRKDFGLHPEVIIPVHIPEDAFKDDIYYFATLILTFFDPDVKRTTDRIFKDYGIDPEFNEKLEENIDSLGKPKNVPDCYWDLIKRLFKYADPISFVEVTEILKDDKFAFQLFGEETDLEVLHEYQNRIDVKNVFDLQKESEEFFHGLLMCS